jgi:hypothetical protein
MPARSCSPPGFQARVEGAGRCRAVLLGDHDAGPARRDDLADLLQYQGHADEVDSDDRLRRGLRRGQPGGVHHISHGAKVAGSSGEVVDGFVGGDVDRRRARGAPPNSTVSQADAAPGRVRSVLYRFERSQQRAQSGRDLSEGPQ